MAYTVIVFSEVEHESNFAKVRIDYIHGQLQSVQLKSAPYFNMSNLFTKIYSMLYYTTNQYLQ